MLFRSVCLQRLEETTDVDPTLLDDLPTSARRQIDRVRAWVDTADSGDLAEFPDRLDSAVAASITVTSDECPGARRCPVGEKCFAERARARAAEADIVIVNTHLYGLDIASDGALLPPHDLVVVDEVHGLEDIISDCVGLEFSSGRLRWLAGIVSRVIAENGLVDRITNLGPRLDDVLSPDLGRRMPVPLPAEVTAVVSAARLVLVDVLEALRKVSTSDEDADQRRLRAQQAAGRLAEALDAMLVLDSSWVPFVAGTAATPRLEIAPLDVAPVLSRSEIGRAHV